MIFIIQSKYFLSHLEHQYAIISSTALELTIKPIYLNSSVLNAQIKVEVGNLSQKLNRFTIKSSIFILLK